jgi:hypothetical protein
VAGAGGVPADATAVVLNLAVTSPTAASYLTVWPAGESRPFPASSINFVAGQTIANEVSAKLGTGGQVRIYNLFGSVHVIADVIGYYRPHDHDDRYYARAATDALNPRKAVAAHVQNETLPATGASYYPPSWQPVPGAGLTITTPAGHTALLTARLELRSWSGIEGLATGAPSYRALDPSHHRHWRLHHPASLSARSLRLGGRDCDSGIRRRCTVRWLFQ